MKGIIVLVAVLAIAVAGKAQFSDSIQYHARLASAGNLNRANDARMYLVNNSMLLGIRKKSISLNANAGWVYGQQNNNLINNDFTGTLDFNLYQNKKLYYWGLGNYTSSYSLKIRNQSQAGLGAAYNFVETPNAWINLSDGILYEHSEIVVNDSTNTMYETFRNSLRLSFRFSYKDVIIFTGSNFLQNALSPARDYIIKSNLNLSFKIRKWVSLTTSFNYNKFSRTNSENMLFSYGLVFDKYF